MKAPYTLSEKFQNALCRILGANTPETAAVKVFQDYALRLPSARRPQSGDFEAWIAAFVADLSLDADIAQMYLENRDAFALTVENGVATIALKTGHRLP